MLKITLIGLLCGIATMVYSQDEICVGKKNDGTDLKAMCYRFPQRIQNFSTDESLRYVCLHFRELTSNGKYIKNKGEIGFYDMVEQEFLWEKPIN